MGALFLLYRVMLSLSTLLLVSFCVAISGQNVNLNDSPCPEIFRFDRVGYELTGFLQINFPMQSVNEIKVEYDIVTPGSSYGSLSLVDDEQTVGYNIINNKPVYYRLEFPRWSVQPRITKVIRNNALICAGPPIQSFTKQTVTLTNTFYLGIHLNNNANQGSVLPPGFSIFYPRPPPNQEYFPKPIPTTTTTTTTTWRPPVNLPPRFPIRPTDPPATLPPRRPAPTPARAEPVTLPTEVEEDSSEDNQVCGVSPASETNQLVYGGQSYTKGSYPWLSAMYVKQKRAQWTYQCIGNLISRNHILTAAHCCEYKSRKSISPTDMIFALGLHDLTRFSTEKGSTNVIVKQIWVHVDYKYGASDADIGLVVLQRSVEFSNFIRPICLWPSEFGDSVGDMVDQRGTIAGWGRTETQDIANIPTAVAMPVVANENCLRSNLAYTYLTSNRSFCAGELNNRGPCNGDSGSGFMIRRNSVWYLRGIVSISLKSAVTGHCDLNSYIVFTDVVKFRSWITKITGGIL